MIYLHVDFLPVLTQQLCGLKTCCHYRFACCCTSAAPNGGSVWKRCGIALLYPLTSYTYCTVTPWSIQWKEQRFKLHFLCFWITESPVNLILGSVRSCCQAFSFQLSLCVLSDVCNLCLDVAIIQRKAAKTALGHSFAQVSCGLIASKALLEERDAHNASRGGGKSFTWKITGIERIFSRGWSSSCRGMSPWVGQVMLEVQAQMGEYAQLRGAWSPADSHVKRCHLPRIAEVLSLVSGQQIDFKRDWRKAFWPDHFIFGILLCSFSNQRDICRIPNGTIYGKKKLRTLVVRVVQSDLTTRRRVTAAWFA